MARGKDQLSFTDEVKTVIAAEREAALDDLAGIAKDAIQQIITSMTGATYDRWEHHWKFEDYPARRSQPLVDALKAKASELAPTLIEEALKDPISFTQKDLAALRALLKDAVIQAAGQLLREKAEVMAEQAIAQMEVANGS